MELKNFQRAILKRTEAYFARVAVEQATEAKHPSMDAWASDGGGGPYRERRNALGEDVPDIWVHVPTGGGKTLLATEILGQVASTILADRGGAGLALWIVPSDQIYRDTLRALTDRTHGYRRSLEHAVGRRVDVWEKHEIARMRPTQLADAFNVLLLKLPSANRESKDTLRLFRDAGGNIVQHFPPEDDGAAQRALKVRIPNLEMVTDDLVRTSVANLIKICRPPVVLDEGHRAFSELAQKTLDGLNVSAIIELSATPPPGANVLARASGLELLAEDMIKLPINVASASETDWKTCLGQAFDKRRELEKLARDRAEKEGKPFIRPIALVQVERTGSDQRDGVHVHAEDVREHLVGRLAVHADAVRVKSAERDDIEGIDLMDDGCPVTWIVTKSALQEGWDCPFAYVLVVLSGSRSSRALTQLVGRVLRQPFTSKTGVRALDESWVFCRRDSSTDVVKDIKAGLEQEGYEGDFTSVVDPGAGGGRAAPVAHVQRQFRPLYREFDGKVYLPKFCVRRPDGKREGLDYYVHLLNAVDVATFRFARVDWNLAPDLDRARQSFYRVTLGEGAARRRRDEPVEVAESDREAEAWLELNLPFPQFSWRETRQIIRGCVDRVLVIAPEVRGRLASVKYVLKRFIERFVDDETDEATHRVFQQLFDAGRIDFYLECRHCRFELPTEVTLRPTRAFTDDRGDRPMKSLFDFVNDDAFNATEKQVALMLDSHPEVLWWYRNAVGTDAFAIQGYRREKFYPDFVVQKGVADASPVAKRASTKAAAKSKSKPTPQPTVLVVETKGEHLEGNKATGYKRDIAQYLEKLGKRVTWQELGQGFESMTFRFQIVDLDKHGTWRNKLLGLLAG